MTRVSLACVVALMTVLASCGSAPDRRPDAKAHHAHAAPTAATDGGPPNLVVIHDRLVTSGQPSAAWLATLAEQGFGAVVYLAPPTVPDAVADEARIVGRQGLTFINIPIPFDGPEARHLQLFSAVLDALGDRKVLVHCQVNFRASSMVFLHRVVALREDPERAYEPVTRTWRPDGVWRRYLVGELARRGVAFEPY